MAKVVARNTSVVRERPVARKTSGMQQRLVAEKGASKTSSLQVRLVAKVVGRKASVLRERPEARQTSSVQGRLLAKAVAMKTSGVREKLVVCRVPSNMQAKRLQTPFLQLLGICGPTTRSVRVELIIWMMTTMRYCVAKTTRVLTSSKETWLEHL